MSVSLKLKKNETGEKFFLKPGMDRVCSSFYIAEYSVNSFDAKSKLIFSHVLSFIQRVTTNNIKQDILQAQPSASQTLIEHESINEAERRSKKTARRATKQLLIELICSTNSLVMKFNIFSNSTFRSSDLHSSARSISFREFP